MPRVLIADKISSRSIDIFHARGIDCDVKTDLSPEDLCQVITVYDGLIVRSATQVTQDALKAGKSLKVVGRAGIGIDNIDLSAATALGIVVMNTPFGNTVTTAEHTIALMMALARNIPNASVSTKQGKWEKNRFIGIEMYKKTLGIIGCGNIGSIVAQRGLGLKMHVVTYDPFLSTERAQELGIEKISLEELRKRADFISLHTPLTETTKEMVNREFLKKCKKGVYLINCARGELVHEQDLRDALDQGHVAGVALDVFSKEPAYDNVLFGSDKVICTPHLGAATSEAQENVALQIAEQMSDFFLLGTVSNALNMPFISAEEQSLLRPYFELSEKLGCFVGQLIHSGLRSIDISYYGDVTLLNYRPLTSIILKGILASLLEGVNMVSASVVAKERGIEITESKHEAAHGHYPTLIQITITTDSSIRSFAGSLLDGHRVRMVNIDDIPLEAELSPYILFVRNEDKPGFIGRLGTTLGQAHINIASFHLGRKGLHQEAVSLLSLDNHVDLSVLHQIRQLPGVIEAHIITIPQKPMMFS